MYIVSEYLVGKFIFKQVSAQYLMVSSIVF